MPTDGHNLPNHPSNPHQEPRVDPEHPGYEVSDADVKNVAVFLVGLFGTVIVFFFFCYGMGKVINNLWEKEDGPATKWAVESGAATPTGKRRDLTSNAQLEQEELQQMTNAFPTPRLEMDDGNQDTADLHAREDLLLEHYSLVDGQPGTIRIPIERAMQLIVQRGLPVQAPGTAAPDDVAHAALPQVQAPLTTGFARTGYELQTIVAREEKMAYGDAEAAQTEAPPQK